MSVFIIEHCFKKYVVDKKEINVLNDINLSFPEQGLVSIVGKSGSGKSTLLNLLMGIEKPTKGKILFDNKNIVKFNDKKFSNFHLTGASLIFQHYNLFDNETALRNVMTPLLMKGYTRVKAKKIAIDFFKKFHIQELAYRKAKTLSGGEKQRVAIIRSLVVNPKVILCDEPTGALDGKNSVEVMQILKEISVNKLVIMVSHNFELVNRFSDQIITLKDGNVISNISNIKNHFSNRFEKKKFKYSGKWSKKFLLTDFFKNIKKNLFSIFACIISFTSIFLSLGFINGSTYSENEALEQNLSLNFSTVSQTEFIDLDNSPIQYQKIVRPTLESVDNVFGDFNSIICEENVSYFISDYATCSFNKKLINNFALIPLCDETLTSFGSNLIKQGSSIGRNFEEVIINNEFANLLNEENLIGKELIISSQSTVTSNTGDKNNPFIKDTFSYSKKFLIKGVVNEFSFLNTPKIYYSYYGAKHFLQSEIMPSLSEYKGKAITYFDYIRDSKEDDVVSSYSYYLFIKDYKEIDGFFSRVKELKNKNNLIQVESTPLDIKETYSTFIASFSSSLFVFVIVAFLGINFILGMISLSTFIEGKKNTAILTCIGSRNKTIYNLFLNQNLIVVYLSFFISIPVTIIAQKYLNSLLFNQFALKKLILVPFLNYLNIPFGLLIFVFLIASFFSILFTLIPMLFYRNFSLADELRDE